MREINNSKCLKTKKVQVIKIEINEMNENGIGNFSLLINTYKIMKMLIIIIH